MMIIDDEVNDDNLFKLIIMLFYSLDEPKCVQSRGCLQLLVLSIKLRSILHADQSINLKGKVTEKVQRQSSVFFASLADVILISFLFYFFKASKLKWIKLQTSASILCCNIPPTRRRYFPCLWWPNDVTTARQMSTLKGYIYKTKLSRK